MTSSESSSELVMELAEEFLARYRKGERPPLREYIDRHPELAEEIKDVFPAMAMMENIAVVDESIEGPTPKADKSVVNVLRQLGDYRIIREIGHGGMGVVYEAEQVSLGRHVALKLLPKHALHDSKQKRRFEREARAAAKLHHTNIVPVFGVGEHESVPYYVMQFIQGLGLDAVLSELNRMQPSATKSSTGMQSGGEIRISRRDVSAADVARSLMTGGFDQSADRGGAEPADPQLPTAFAATVDCPAEAQGSDPSLGGSSAGRLSDSFTVSSSSITVPGSGTRKSAAKKQTYWQSVANIGLQVADALEYAHKQGVLHRDVKPSNLLLDMRGTVWVTDFGLAKLAGSGADTLTHTGDILGTLRYMPPEAFEGLSDVRSDVYSLGLTLYELLAMQPAFNERERNKLIKQVTTGEPPPLDKVRKEVPRDLVTIIHKAIAREPSRRYATAEDLAADLQRFLDDEPILARRQTHVERFVRWARHNPGIASLSSVLAAMMVLATVASLVAASYFNQLRVNESQAAQNERDARQEADLSRQAELQHRLKAEKEKQRADDEARLAREAGQDARDRATAEAAAKTLAQQEKERADANAKKAEERAGAARKAEEEAKVQLSRAQWLVYASKLSLAQTDFETSNGALALHYLDECQWDLRGWEHRYLWTRINAKLSLGHIGPLSGAVFSPGGRRILTGGWGDTTGRVWDAATGQELVIVRHGVAIRSVAFSPDGKLIATAGGDLGQPNETKVWDSVTGQHLLTLKGHQGWVISVAFSPDGRRIVTGGGDIFKPGDMKLWDAETGQELRTFKEHPLRIWSAAFSPDGKRIVTGSDDPIVRVWDAATGEEVRTLKGHTHSVMHVAFSPDGKRIVTASQDKTAKVWDAATGEDILTLKGHTGWVQRVAFSPDNTRIVTGSTDATLRVWDAATGLEVLALKGHTDQVTGAAFSSDGTRIVSASADHTARVWDAERGQKVLMMNGQTGPVRSVAFRPDSARLVAMRGVWDAVTGQKLLALNAADGQGPVAFSPNGQRIVAGRNDGTARVLDAESGRELLTLKGHTAMVLGVAFSPDGNRIATGAFHDGVPGAVRVWDAEMGHQLLAIEGLKNRVWCVAFSPDSRRIVTCDDRNAKTWDAVTGKELMTLEGHQSEVWSAAFSLDGKQIVTGCLDKMVRVFDAETGKIVHTLKGHTDGVWSVTVSPDGKRIFSGSQDNTVRVWDAGKGQELLALKCGSNVFSVAMSPNGKHLAAGCEDGTVKVWVADRAQAPRDDNERADLLKDRLPAMLQEMDQPTDNSERLILAKYAFEHQKFAFATRCWTEVLAGDPKLSDDRENMHRYNAARAAALAAAGQGRDEPPLNEPAKAKFRRQSLDWLKAETVVWSEFLKSGPTRESELALYTLSGWKHDSTLAGIRDAAALAKLPPEEHATFTQYWADFTSMLKTENAKISVYLQEELVKARKTPPKDDSVLAYLLARIGRTYLERDLWAEAEPYLRESMALREKSTPDSWTTFNTYSTLGGSLLGQKKYSDAEAMLLKGYHGMKERESTIPPIGKDRIPETLDRLIDFYTVANKPDEVKKWQAERAKKLETSMPGGKR